MTLSRPINSGVETEKEVVCDFGLTLHGMTSSESRVDETKWTIKVAEQREFSLQLLNRESG